MTCCAMTEQQKYDRDERYTLAVEQFQLEEASCNAAGGVIMTKKWSASRIPHRMTLFELRTAECVDPKNIIDDMKRQGY